MVIVAPQRVGSSQNRDWTRVPCIGRQILYHWATRKAPVLKNSLFDIFRFSLIGIAIENGSDFFFFNFTLNFFFLLRNQFFLSMLFKYKLTDLTSVSSTVNSATLWGAGSPHSWPKCLGCPEQAALFVCSSSLNELWNDLVLISGPLSSASCVAAQLVLSRVSV